MFSCNNNWTLSNLLFLLVFKKDVAAAFEANTFEGVFVFLEDQLSCHLLKVIKETEGFQYMRDLSNSLFFTLKDYTLCLFNHDFKRGVWTKLRCLWRVLLTASLAKV